MNPSIDHFMVTISILLFMIFAIVGLSILIARVVFPLVLRLCDYIGFCVLTVHRSIDYLGLLTVVLIIITTFGSVLTIFMMLQNEPLADKAREVYRYTNRGAEVVCKEGFMWRKSGVSGYVKQNKEKVPCIVVNEETGELRTKLTPLYTVILMRKI